MSNLGQDVTIATKACETLFESCLSEPHRQVGNELGVRVSKLVRPQVRNALISCVCEAHGIVFSACFSDTLVEGGPEGTHTIVEWNKMRKKKTIASARCRYNLSKKVAYVTVLRFCESSAASNLPLALPTPWSMAFEKKRRRRR